MTLVANGVFEGSPPGSTGWKLALEEVAREFDADFLEGQAGTWQIKSRWIPRGVIWALVKRREWRMANGERTHGWW